MEIKGFYEKCKINFEEENRENQIIKELISETANICGFRKNNN